MEIMLKNINFLTFPNLRENYTPNNIFTHFALLCCILQQSMLLYNHERRNVMNTVAIRLPANLVKQASHYADVNLRTIPKQIEYWAMLGRCAEDNPDLPLDFIKECLLAKDEVKLGDTTTFKFRNE